jgi:3-phenylpropionate/cinnamic acid dioxygenase small subunit
VLAFFGAAFAAQSDQRRHVVSNIRLLESTEDRARVEAYLTLIVTDEGTTALKSAGRYDAVVVGDETGWRFRAMTLFLDSGF